jgi:hypothetical protein
MTQQLHPDAPAILARLALKIMKKSQKAWLRK